MTLAERIQQYRAHTAGAHLRPGALFTDWSQSSESRLHLRVFKDISSIFRLSWSEI